MQQTSGSLLECIYTIDTLLFSIVIIVFKKSSSFFPFTHYILQMASWSKQVLRTQSRLMRYFQVRFYFQLFHTVIITYCAVKMILFLLLPEPS